MIGRAIVLAAAIAMLGGCASISGARAEKDRRTLASWMEGSFSSAEQAASDPEYRDIRLHIARIWRERTDGPWLYVEQAAAGQPPYRQRVYRLTNLGDRFGDRLWRYSSEVYTLPGDVHRFDGAWSDPTKLAGVTPADLSLREGCAVVLWFKGDYFEGGTEGTGCASELAGAKYATSKVRVTADTLESWDQGFNEKGEQVWGATKGAYIFKKEK